MPASPASARTASSASRFPCTSQISPRTGCDVNALRLLLLLGLLRRLRRVLRSHLGPLDRVSACRVGLDALLLRLFALSGQAPLVAGHRRRVANLRPGNGERIVRHELVRLMADAIRV